MADLQEIKETFELLDDWEDRYKYIIDLGKHLEPMDEALKTPATKVNGCISQVWMIPETRQKDGKTILHFVADSDAFIVKGLIAVLFAIYQDKTPDEIRQTDLEPLFEDLKLEEHLSPNRRNGFYAMIERIKSFASGPSLNESS